MNRIPMRASVFCTDGLAGQSTGIIVDPATLRPTHIIAKMKEPPKKEYLIPLTDGVKISGDEIWLDFQKSELDKMDPFTVVEYQSVPVPRYSVSPEFGVQSYAYAESEMIEVRKEMVPKGKRALHEGMEVHASDGKVGKVDELIVDAESGSITHFLMREKQLWGSRAVVIPLTLIDHVESDTVYLTPDKQTIRSYLAVPVGRRKAADDIELLIIMPETADKPANLLKSFKAAAEQENVKLYSTAVIIKDEQGKVVIRESEDLDKRRGAILGAVTGGVVGLLGGPAGVIIGAAAGAATGGVAAKRIDLGLPDDYLQRMQARMQPGSAVIVALVEANWDEKVTNTSFGLEATLLRHQLTDDVLDQLTSGNK